ncbi:hypothetical protein [Pseudonocardia thermophila]|uniref:hypothetical protein n=1 Tax=Pseudonocardia thermophila TaxID=1848 RepID=UPI00248ED03F|nr:hypothetical protein [Pseudonocardia thermophila]
MCIAGDPHPYPALVGEDHSDVVGDELLDLTRFGDPGGDGDGGEFPREFEDRGSLPLGRAVLLAHALPRV